jgi:acetyl esterase/lipase
MRKTNWLVCLCLLYSTCIFAQLSNYCIRNRFAHESFFAESDIQQDLNVTYATVRNYFPRPSGRIENLQMDVYAPKTTVDMLPKRPLLLILHGGSFLAGTRADMTFPAKEFARRGFVTATISYRLGWGCTDSQFQLCNAACLNANLTTAIYQATQDARAAARYLMANADRFRIDTAAFFIMGASAGAMTALNTVYLDADDQAKYYPNEIAKVGLLDTSGNSLTQRPTFKGIINYCGALLNDSIISPRERVPLVSFHDEFDCIVPFRIGQLRNCLNCDGFARVSGSQTLHTRQQTLGVCSELNYVPNSLQHCGYPIAQVINQSVCFLKYLICGQCRSGLNPNPNVVPACLTVETNDITEGGHFTCQPNPTSDVLQIELSDDFKTATNLRISVVNALGEQVLEQKMDAITPISLSVKGWSSGIYMVRIHEGSLLRGAKKVVVTF